MTRQRSRGVTLIEILVAILIISFGLLGTAGLQAIGLRAAIGANQRTTATLLAYDIADRMRANMDGYNLNHYDNWVPVQNLNCISTVGCSPQEMAQHDMYEWNQAIAAALPSGIGIVCKDSSPDDGANNLSMITAACDTVALHTNTIKIWWLEDRSASNPTGTLKRFVTTVNP